MFGRVFSDLSMNESPEANTRTRDPKIDAPLPSPSRSPVLRNFWFSIAALLALFSVPLYQLVQFALPNELYSHLWLIPFVSLGLVWLNRSQLPQVEATRPDGWTLGLLAAGLVLSGWYLTLAFSPAPTELQNLLALVVYAFAALVAASIGFFLGSRMLRAVAFPLGLLIFMAPFPLVVEAMMESFLQHASSLTAHGMFVLSGMPFMREATYFRLPGFSMEVAPECSGIHSTLALFLTSLVAGQVLLRSPWKRAVLALVVIPIALLRNGLRVFTIGQLCVRIGPEMIDSWIHRQGGPFFFLLSLIPFSLVLLYLIKTDRKARRPTSATPLR